MSDKRDKVARLWATNCQYTWLMRGVAIQTRLRTFACHTLSVTADVMLLIVERTTGERQQCKRSAESSNESFEEMKARGAVEPNLGKFSKRRVEKDAEDTTVNLDRSVNIKVKR